MKKIMIVEDDHELLSIYSDLFQTEGIEVITAENGKEALEKIKSIIPNLILLDIMLPGGLDGLDLLKLFKQEDKYKNIPVIMLTNLDGNMKIAKSLGAADYIVKVNISIDDLVNKIKMFL
jgi:DNA-binding response OmpR family regulator